MKIKMHKYGDMLSEEELDNISNHIELSFHASKRIEERGKNLGRKLDYISEIKKSSFAYLNNDGTYNVGLNGTKCYFVIKPTKNSFFVITFKEESNNKISLQRKRELCLNGVTR